MKNICTTAEGEREGESEQTEIKQQQRREMESRLNVNKYITYPHKHIMHWEFAHLLRRVCLLLLALKLLHELQLLLLDEAALLNVEFLLRLRANSSSSGGP